MPSARASVLLAAVVVAVFLFAYCYAAPTADKRREGFLSGFWTGSPEFLKSARLSQLALFFPSGGGGGVREGFLRIVSDDGRSLCDRPVTFRFPALSGFGGFFSAGGFSSAEPVSCESPPPGWPSDLLLEYDVPTGGLRVSSAEDNSEVFAALVKDNETSLFAEKVGAPYEHVGG